METEITIFDIPEKELDINKSQRELEYEIFEKNSKLESHHFRRFYEMELLEESSTKPKSNILSILVKYILNYCYPIVTNNIDSFNITLQLDNVILSFQEETKDYINIGANEQFLLVGFILPEIFIKHYNKHMLSHFDHISDKDLIISGQYGLADLLTQKYTQQRESFSYLQNYLEQKIYIDEKTATDKINMLLNYIEYIETYYQTALYTLYQDANFASNRILEESKLNPITKIEQISTLLEKNQKVFDELDKKQLAKFGNVFDHDVYNTLEMKGLTKLFHIGSILDLQDELFQDELAIKSKNLNVFNEFIKQQNEGFKKKLEIIKKQNIAFNKYGQDNLDLLDEKQKSVIELEYKKLEKNKTITTQGQNLQKLFANLQASFVDLTPENLKKNLKLIKDEVGADLKKEEILPGGVCPHVYYYGEKFLENFNKPWANTTLREYLIETYALPKDLAGYFCRICGEIIAFPDNEDVLRFIGGERIKDLQQDDPLQTAIWKEAMYIITTYVKFNSLVPLKPLINSLASGLRNVIGEQETLLYKGKTNTIDSIKDTVSLYTTIYIYAALCSLMMANPNKIIFGREKSSDNRDDRDNRQIKSTESIPYKDLKDIEISDTPDKTDVETIKQNIDPHTKKPPLTDNQVVKGVKVGSYSKPIIYKPNNSLKLKQKNRKKKQVGKIDSQIILLGGNPTDAKSSSFLTNVAVNLLEKIANKILKPLAEQMVNKVDSTLKEKAENLIKEAKSVLEKIGDATTVIIENKSNLEGIFQEVKEQPQKLLNKFDNKITETKEMITNKLAELEKRFSTLENNLSIIVQNIESNKNIKGGRVDPKVSSYGGTVFEDVQKKAKQLANEANDKAKQLANEASDKAKQLANEASDKAKQVANEANKQVEQLATSNNIRNGVSTATTVVAGPVGSMVANAVLDQTHLDQTASNVAQNGIQNLNDRADHLVDQANKMTNNQIKSMYKYVHGGKSTQNIKIYERFLLTTAMKLIVLTKDSVIHRLKNINVDVIKQIFLKQAYVWARKHVKPIKVDHKHEPKDDIFSIIKNDPFYNYFYYATVLGSKKQHEEVSNVAKFLNTTNAKIEEDPSQIYENAKVPEPWNFKNKLLDEYTYGSFMSLFDYINNKLFTRECVPRHVQLKEHYEKYAYLLDMQKQIREQILRTKIVPLYGITMHNDIRGKYNNFKQENIDLAQFYCPNGERHKIGIYIYSIKEKKGAGKKKKTSKKAGADNTIEYSKDEILSITTDENKINEWLQLKLIDERCSKCKLLIRNAESTQKLELSMANMFKKIDNVIAFYQYFETRCPEGDLHDIQNNICTKCKFDTSFKKASNMEYYNKYLNKFNKIQKQKQELHVEQLGKIEKSLESVILDRKKRTHAYSLQNLAIWSQLSGVKYNILLNIGLTEGVKFEDIEKGKANPFKSFNQESKIFKTQAIKLKGYILHVLRDYNMIMNHESIVDIEPTIKKILDAHKNLDLSKMLNLDDFLEKSDGYNKIEPYEYANYLLEYLSTILVEIQTKVPDKYKDFGKALSSHFTKQIVEKEKLLSKPESIYAKLKAEAAAVESDIEEDNATGEDFADKSDKSVTEPEFEDEKSETYENDIDEDAYDVEDVNAIFENE